LIEALVKDYTTAPITPAERALLDYAVRLTREPWTITAEDIATLRAAGWSDFAILDLNLVASYFAFVNRLADGLGVPLEPRWGQQEKR
jgi:uncharacterized peroxidase-related enzyme